MLEWMLMPLRRYAEFSGRSRRKEYWMFILLNMIVYVVILSLMGVTGGLGAAMENADPADPFAMYSGLLGGVGIVLLLWSLATLIPNIALNVRRLHDRDMSGWWYLGVFVVALIPLVGFLVSIAYLVLMCLEGTKGPNRFGPDPKGGDGAEVFS